ncbi:molybdenum cofactor biosynthesis protein [bacterium 3DAC]|nr:molybdenum cofactor biosynthesis protein [bacterium 3DAC]
MKKFHNTTPWDNVLSLVENTLKSMLKPQIEEIPVKEAIGRVSAREVWAKRNVPHFLAAAVDGYAVKSDRFKEAHTANPIRVAKDSVRYVNTGDPVYFPEEDAVYMQEDVLEDGEFLVFHKSISVGKGIRFLGEDVIKNDLIVWRNTYLLPEHIALMRAAGVKTVEVYKPISVTIIPTGEEMKAPEGDLKEGDLPETSSLMVAQYVERFGGTVSKIYSPVPNDIDKLSQALKDGLQNADIVLFIGGSSRGKHDLIAPLIENMGTLLVHGIRIRPSKPTIIGIVENKPVIGLPGYPTATYYILQHIVKPLIEVFMPKDKEIPHQTEKATLSVHVPSPGGVAELLRIVVGKAHDEKNHAITLGSGSSKLFPITMANAHLFIPEGSEGYKAGEEVEIIKVKGGHPLLAMASDDMAFKLLLSLLREKNILVSYAKKGSLGSIGAFNKGQVYLAGAHLLDPQTGQYNKPFIKKPAKLILMAKREQGFIVQKGNPKNISSFEDIRRIKFVNREKGSGTRMLLDYLLAKYGISPSEIDGYMLERFSHLQVAMTVAIGMADAGLGIKAAADALDLDFVPVHTEEYHIIIPEGDEALAQNIIDVLRSTKWQAKVQEIGGYDVSASGKVVK